MNAPNIHEDSGATRKEMAIVLVVGDDPVRHTDRGRGMPSQQLLYDRVNVGQ